MVAERGSLRPKDPGYPLWPFMSTFHTQVAVPMVTFEAAKRSPQKEGMQVTKWAEEAHSGFQEAAVLVCLRI